MNNKTKVIGILVASVGVVASFASAFALYTKEVGNVGFGIGAASYTSTGTVNYTINGASGASNVAPTFFNTTDPNDFVKDPLATKFDNAHQAVQYDFELGADFSADVTAQEFVAGNISVSFSNLKEAFVNHTKISVWIDGYDHASYGDNHYAGQLTTGNTTPLNNYVMTTSSVSIDAKDITVRAAEPGLNQYKQSLHVYVGLLGGFDTLAMNEAASLWDLSVTWAKPSSGMEKAYIMNDKSLWKTQEEFVMTRNIDKGDGDQWTGTIQGSAQLTAAKCAIGDTWEVGDTENPPDNNHALIAGHTYKFYWSGSSSDAASVVDITNNS